MINDLIFDLGIGNLNGFNGPDVSRLTAALRKERLAIQYRCRRAVKRGDIQNDRIKRKQKGIQIIQFFGHTYLTSKFFTIGSE